MANFSMTCTCGDVLNIEAPNREGAVSQLKAMMDESGIEHHFQEKHSPSDPRPTVEQVHGMIEQAVVAA